MDFCHNLSKYVNTILFVHQKFGDFLLCCKALLKRIILNICIGKGAMEGYTNIEIYSQNVEPNLRNKSTVFKE